MIIMPYIGEFLLYASCLCFLSVAFKKKAPYSVLKSGAIFGIMALLVLIHGFLTSNFAFALVANYSHTDKHILYKIGATWSNHEGSMLLWFALQCGFNLIYIRAQRIFTNHSASPNAQKSTAPTAGVVLFAILNAGLCAYILLTSNPFLVMETIPNQGLDLNPVLQDPLLSIHPPILYTGYVMTSYLWVVSIVYMIEKTHQQRKRQESGVFSHEDATFDSKDLEKLEGRQERSSQDASQVLPQDVTKDAVQTSFKNSDENRSQNCSQNMQKSGTRESIAQDVQSMLKASQKTSLGKGPSPKSLTKSTVFPPNFKRLTLLCLAIMTLGLTLGSFWAYYELGWGGFWFWDPVESLSLLPWLCVLIAVHQLHIKSFSLWIPISYLSVLFMTFMVRSGLLTSVHTFADDPMRGRIFGTYFLFVTCITVGVIYQYRKRMESLNPSKSILTPFFSAFHFKNAQLGFGSNGHSLSNTALYAKPKAPEQPSPPPHLNAISDFETRTGGHHPLNSYLGKHKNENPSPQEISPQIPLKQRVLNAKKTIITLMIGIILFGVLYPVFKNNNDIQLGERFFHKILIPLVAPLLMGILITNTKTITQKFIMETCVWVALLCVLGLGIEYKWDIFGSLFYNFMMMLSLAVVAQSIVSLWNRFKIFMQISHLGFAMVCCGVILSGCFSRELTVPMHENQHISFQNMHVTIQNIERKTFGNYNAVLFPLTIKHHQSTFTLKPELRFYTQQKMIHAETSIHTTLLHHIYGVVVEENGQYILQLHYKYAINILWLGLFLMFAGIVLARMPSFKNLKAPNFKK